jgi:hypothetical protein
MEATIQSTFDPALARIREVTARMRRRLAEGRARSPGPGRGRVAGAWQPELPLSAGADARHPRRQGGPLAGAVAG